MVLKWQEGRDGRGRPDCLPWYHGLTWWQDQQKPPPFKVAVMKEYVDYGMIHSAKEHWGLLLLLGGRKGMTPVILNITL